MQIGILVDSLDYSQQSFMLLHQVYNTAQDIKHTPIIFIKDNQPPYLIPMCAVINSSELFNFKGLLITTTFKNLRIAQHSAKEALDIIYYMMDLEWLRNERDFVSNLMLLKNTKIIVQNKYHENAIYNYCNNKPVSIIPHFNLDAIAGYYERTRDKIHS